MAIKEVWDVTENWSTTTIALDHSEEDVEIPVRFIIKYEEYHRSDDVAMSGKEAVSPWLYLSDIDELIKALRDIQDYCWRKGEGY